MLTQAEIKKIALLARLKLTEEEVDQYNSQLNSVFDYIKQLQEVNIDGIEPTAQVTGLENVMREDVNIDCSPEIIQTALSQAELEDGELKVKKVL